MEDRIRSTHATRNDSCASAAVMRLRTCSALRRSLPRFVLTAVAVNCVYLSKFSIIAPSEPPPCAQELQLPQPQLAQMSHVKQEMVASAWFCCESADSVSIRAFKASRALARLSWALSSVECAFVSMLDPSY